MIVDLKHNNLLEAFSKLKMSEHANYLAGDVLVARMDFF